MKKDNPAIPTFTGKLVDPLNLRPEDIDIRDIAHHLSLVCRYSGATPVMYSVAQHCCYVALMVPPSLMLPALLHDAAEAYLGDLTHPVKHGLNGIGPHFREAERRAERVIEEALGLEYRALESPAVKQADEDVFQLEWSHFIDGEENNIRPWTSESSEVQFLLDYADAIGVDRRVFVHNGGLVYSAR